MKTSSSHTWHPPEEELIAYSLGENGNAPLVREHVCSCQSCEAFLLSLSDTLSFFGEESIPTPDLVRNWTRLERSLPSQRYNPKPITFRYWYWATGFASALVLLVLVFAPRHDVSSTSSPHAIVVPSDHSTRQSVDALLESSERVLTVASHRQGELDSEDRDNIRLLLKENTAYLSGPQTDTQQIRPVLEQLQVTLTQLSHVVDEHGSTTADTNGSPWQPLLLELRILNQNRKQEAGPVSSVQSVEEES